VSRLALLIAVAAGIAGCSGSLVELRNTPSGKHYMQSLVTAQTHLAVAERAIPSSAPTPAALAASIRLLGRAIDGLHGDLSSIKPPPSARAQHLRLLAIVSGYSRRLAQAAAEAGRPGGLAAAGNELLSATSAASADFAATVQKINKELVK
jgi:hypothetical protein